MLKALLMKKIGTAAIATVILLYFMTKSPSPKLLFIPFLVCSVASLGKNIGLLTGRRSLARGCDLVFKVGFFVFWFGFLIVADVIAIRDARYGLLALTVLFWVGGILFARRKFSRMKRQTKNVQDS